MVTATPKSDFRMPRCNGIDIEKFKISQLQSHLRSGAFTSVNVVQCYRQRISQLNPRIKAVIEINPDALEIARKLDEERQNGIVRSPLHGIPFLAKDNIATKDKMQTTAGSSALLGTVISRDARVITLLWEAGAILLGKSNLSEFASMRASYYSEGYSSRGGQNRNPYNLAHHPGGSSSGSASAVACNMCAFALGTETDGSVMFPADRCAVVGIKPSVGLVSTEGVIPEAPSLDTVGVFGRYVGDVAIVLDVIAVRGVCSDAGVESPGIYISNLRKTDALKGVRFGIPWKRVWEAASKSMEMESQYRTLMEVIDKMRSAGAEIINVDFPSAEEIISPQGWDWTFAEGKTNSILSEFTVVRTEFYHNLKEYLSSLERNPNNINSLEDIIAYNIQHSPEEGGVSGTHPAWPTGQDNFDKCIKSKHWSASVHDEALAYIHLKSRSQGIDAVLANNKNPLDALLVPLQADGGAACSVAAKAGYPMSTIPVGVDEEGVPFGIGLMHTAGKEEELVMWASAIEDLVGKRRLPKFENWEANNWPYIGCPP